MSLFPLPLFPEGSHFASIITTVWVGVLVMAFFNLRFGWVFSGLAVPGYLVPLLILKPWCAALNIVEAVVTYLIVRGIFDGLSGKRSWSGVIGQDRFFAVLLVSVIVRLAMDWAIVPGLAGALETRLGIRIDWQNNLHSIGLVIVALMANQFWKSGALRGSACAAVVIGMTYGIVRFVFMEATNFNIGGLQYLYEDKALSILASPRSYIILLVSALVASRMNLRYGWDFNGLLIPSLLALSWYEPLRIVGSLVEAAVIFVVGGLVLRLPQMKRSSIEGARKVVIFFTVAFAYKLVLGHIVFRVAPTVKVTDYLGIGYLLSTFLALRAHQHDIALRMMGTTVQTSLASALLAAVLGFALTLLPFRWMSVPAAGAAPVASETRIPVRLLDVLRKEQVRLFAKRVPESFVRALPGEIEDFRSGISLLEEYVRSPQPQLLAKARDWLHSAHYGIDEIGGRYFLLREQAPARGWGLYVIDTRPSSQLLVEVPAPLDETFTLEAGVLLLENLGAGALAIAGSSRSTNADGSSDVARHSGTPFYVFHSIFSRRNVLVVGAYTAETVRLVSGARPGPQELDLPHVESRLWVKSEIPAGLNLPRLKALIGPYVVEWGGAPWPSVLRDSTWTGFAELTLNSTTLRRLLVSGLSGIQAVEIREGMERIEGYLQDRLFGTQNGIAERGTNLYVPATQEELLFLDETVISPAIQASRFDYGSGGFTDAGKETLLSASAAATLFGYELVWFRHRPSREDYLILQEKAGTSTQRYWGTYVFRLSPSQPFVVTVPRPSYETNSMEQGIALFERLHAGSLLLSGTNPTANLGGESDLVRERNKLSLLSLVHQVLLRKAGEASLVMVHCRAFSRETLSTLSPPADVLVATDRYDRDLGTCSGLIRLLGSALQEDGFEIRFVDGRPETAGYEAGSSFHSRYLSQCVKKEFVLLWFSPLARMGFRQHTEDHLETAKFDALGIATDFDDLAERLILMGPLKGVGRIPEELRSFLKLYQETQDIVALRLILDRWKSWEIRRMIDRESRRSFLLLRADALHWPLVVNLSPRPGTLDPVIVEGPPNRPRIRRFVDIGAPVLELRGAP